MWSFFSRDHSKEFPFEIVEKKYHLTGETLFSIHLGKAKPSGDLVTIFCYDIKTGNAEQTLIVRNTIRRLKTFRHPAILTYLGSHETDSIIYLVTEYVEPLKIHLLKYYSVPEQRQLYIAWGILQVTKALMFLNFDAKLRHNNVFSGAVFINKACEWKLGEVGYLTDINDPYPTKVISGLKLHTPPEISTKSNSSIGRNSVPLWTYDSWGLGILIWEVYNGRMMQGDSLKNVSRLPSNMVELYSLLVAADPGLRISFDEILNRGFCKKGIFDNSLVRVIQFLEEIQMREKTQITNFFSDLSSLIDTFPCEISKNKILPQVINAFEFGEAGVSVLTPLLKLSKLLSPEEHEKITTPCIIKLYASNDRATRSKLLQSLGDYVEFISPTIVNKQLFPLIINGFLDSNPVIRESTVKSFVHLAPKLDHNNINVTLLQHFARLQSKDDQGGIRTNTTVCLGKIAPFISPQVRQKVLISAFVRALRDPFPPARVAGILALVATQQFYTVKDIAERVLPALVILSVDLDESVRVNTFRALKGLLEKLEKLSDNPTLKEDMEKDVTSSSGHGLEIASWAQWAASAISSKLYVKKEDKPKDQESTADETRENSEERFEDSSSGLGFKKSPEVEEGLHADMSFDSGGWELEDWPSLENSNAGDELCLEIKQLSQQQPSDNFYPETLPNVNQDEEVSKPQEISSRRNIRNSEKKPKPRQSGPMKLGVKKS